MYTVTMSNGKQYIAEDVGTVHGILVMRNQESSEPIQKLVKSIVSVESDGSVKVGTITRFDNDKFQLAMSDLVREYKYKNYSESHRAIEGVFEEAKCKAVLELNDMKQITFDDPTNVVLNGEIELLDKAEGVSVVFGIRDGLIAHVERKIK